MSALCTLHKEERRWSEGKRKYGETGSLGDDSGEIIPGIREDKKARAHLKMLNGQRNDRTGEERVGVVVLADGPCSCFRQGHTQQRSGKY